MAGLRGKVVVVDFWTYSCINCIRSLPYVEAWYRKYAAYGLVVVGVHTPEFAFEHDTSNVQAAIAASGSRTRWLRTTGTAPGRRTTTATGRPTI